MSAAGGLSRQYAKLCDLRDFGDPALLRAIQRWRQVQDTLERSFFATRVPVR